TGEVATGAHQVVYDHRRQALERFVQQDDLRIPYQGPCDRQHLLLATGEIATAALAPLLQPGEHRVDAVERPSVRCGQAGKDDVLLDIEATEDAAVFRDQLYASLRDTVWRLAGEVLSVENHLARARRHHAHQAL